MIDGIAHHVHQGVGEFLGDRLVQFDVVAAGDEFDLFAHLAREVANEARVTLEELPDGNHAHRHGGLLHLAGDAFELREIALQARIGDGGKGLVVAQDGLGDDHLAHHVHEIVELGGVDADTKDIGLALRLLLGGRGGRLGGGFKGRRGGLRHEGAHFRKQTVMTVEPPAGSGGFDGGDSLVDGIDALENHVDDGGSYGQLPFPGQIEGGLDLVRNLLNGGEFEESGHALDGVKPPENGVNGVGVRGVAFKGEQALLDRGEMFARFENEIGDDLGIVRELVFRVVRGGRTRGIESVLNAREPFPQAVRDRFRAFERGSAQLLRRLGGLAVAGLAGLGSKLGQQREELPRAVLLLSRAGHQQPGGEFINTFPQ